MGNIELYTGTVTAGGTDGTAVSEGTELAPIYKSWLWKFFRKSRPDFIWHHHECNLYTDRSCVL